MAFIEFDGESYPFALTLGVIDDFEEDTGKRPDNIVTGEGDNQDVNLRLLTRLAFHCIRYGYLRQKTEPPKDLEKTVKLFPYEALGSILNAYYKEVSKGIEAAQVIENEKKTKE